MSFSTNPPSLASQTLPQHPSSSLSPSQTLLHALLVIHAVYSMPTCWTFKGALSDLLQLLYHSLALLLLLDNALSLPSLPLLHNISNCLGYLLHSLHAVLLRQSVLCLQISLCSVLVGLSLLLGLQVCAPLVYVEQ